MLKTEKRKATGHDTSSKKKISRKFNENWTKELKWFRYDNEKQLMCWFAQILLPLENRGNHPISFIKACSNFKTSALKDNESSKLHTDAVAHFEAIENPYNKLWQSKHRFLLMNINDTNYKIIFEMYIHAFVKKKTTTVH